VTADAEATTTSARGRGGTAFVRFARDVSINVIANLVAAAVIYLADTVSGLLPRSTYVIAFAVVIVLFGASLLLLALGLALRGPATLYLLGVAQIALGIALSCCRSLTRTRSPGSRLPFSSSSAFSHLLGASRYCGAHAPAGVDT
jgi:hypothetical protein